MSNYGIKVALPGKNITSTNIKDFVLNSKYDVLKTYIIGTGNLSLTTESATQNNHNIITVTHNLGYIPQCVFYWSAGLGYAGGFFIASKGSPHSYGIIVEKVDTTNFYIDYYYVKNLASGDNTTGLASLNMDFKYYIFIEQGE